MALSSGATAVAGAAVAGGAAINKIKKKDSEPDQQPKRGGDVSERHTLTIEPNNSIESIALTSAYPDSTFTDSLARPLNSFSEIPEISLAPSDLRNKWVFGPNGVFIDGRYFNYMDISPSTLTQTFSQGIPESLHQPSTTATEQPLSPQIYALEASMGSIPPGTMLSPMPAILPPLRQVVALIGYITALITPSLM